VSLRLDDGTMISEAAVTRLRHSMGQNGEGLSLAGIIGEQVVRPCDAPASYALFCLPNFTRLTGEPILYPDCSCRANRLALEGGGWKIVLDCVENERACEEFLKASSGFAVTHIGRLERADGKTFTAVDARPILDALTWYMSFACGRWTGPCLPVGFDTIGQRVWEVSVDSGLGMA
jgi:hypothetical protein